MNQFLCRYLLQQDSQRSHTVRVKQVLLVDRVSLQEVLQHQKESGHQVLLQTRLCDGEEITFLSTCRNTPPSLHRLSEQTWSSVGWKNDPVPVSWGAHIWRDEVWCSCRIGALLVRGHGGQLLQNWEKHWQPTDTVDHILSHTHKKAETLVNLLKMNSVRIKMRRSNLYVPVDHFVPSQTSMQRVGRKVETDGISTGLSTGKGTSSSYVALCLICIIILMNLCNPRI